MKDQFHGLLLNSKIYPVNDLIVYCQRSIADKNVPEWKKNIFQFIITWLDDGDYIMQYSSGTTGSPKELKLSKRSMMLSARKTCDFFDLRFGQTAALCLPIEYIAGKMMVVRAFVGGLNLTFTEPTSMPELSGLGKIDFCAMVPLQVFNSLNSIEALRNVKKLIIGGGEIRDELEMMLRDLPNEVYATYGMAETCSQVAIRRISGTEYERYFTAFPGVTFSADERECLIIKADYIEKQIVTNDVVDLVDDSRFRWIGRYDNLINSGGVKIVPEEVEAVISKTTGFDCAVIGIPDAKLGQKLVLVLEKGGGELSAEELKNTLKEELPKHLQPKDIVYVEEIPRNSSFKVDRRKLTRELTR